MLTGAILIRNERLRQQAEEGYVASHDDVHVDRELACAATAYTIAACTPPGESLDMALHFWPFEIKMWKPNAEPIVNLVKAGALIAAEIDRLIRLNQEKEE